MAVAAFTQELLSFEPVVADDFLFDKNLRQIRQALEKANPGVVTNINLDVGMSPQLIYTLLTRISFLILRYTPSHTSSFSTQKSKPADPLESPPTNSPNRYYLRAHYGCTSQTCCSTSIRCKFDMLG